MDAGADVLAWSGRLVYRTWRGAQLHTMAAYYPEAPTPTQRAAAETMIAALTVLYPCEHCRAEFAERVAAHPPR